MDIMLDAYEVRQGQRNMEILGNLRVESDKATRQYFAKLERQLKTFNLNVERIIKRHAAV